MDLTKLTPAPWRVGTPFKSHFADNPVTPIKADDPRTEGGEWLVAWAFKHACGADAAAANTAFIALARNAFDVQLRRSWWAEPIPAQGEPLCWAAFGVLERYGKIGRFSIIPPEQAPVDCQCPLTALVEADRWMREQEQKEKP